MEVPSMSVHASRIAMRLERGIATLVKPQRLGITFIETMLTLDSDRNLGQAMAA